MFQTTGLRQTKQSWSSSTSAKSVCHWFARLESVLLVRKCLVNQSNLLFYGLNGICSLKRDGRILSLTPSRTRRSSIWLPSFPGRDRLPSPFYSDDCSPLLVSLAISPEETEQHNPLTTRLSQRSRVRQFDDIFD